MAGQLFSSGILGTLFGRGRVPQLWWVVFTAFLRLLLGLGVKEGFKWLAGEKCDTRVVPVCRDVPYKQVDSTPSGDGWQRESKDEKDAKDDDCMFCRYEKEEDAKDEIISPCRHCNNVRAHGSCWNHLMTARRQVDVGLPGEQEILDERPPDRRCPNCRVVQTGLTAIKLKVPKAQAIRGVFAGGFPSQGWDKDDVPLFRYDLKEGEEFRIHPWILFRDKIQRQIERDQDGRFFARVLFKERKQTYSVYYPILHKGDVVLKTYGPLVVVSPDSKSEQWPLNWNSERYLQYAGEAAIRFYHGAVNFNAEHVKNKMLEILSRDIPLWECAEHDCLAWINSPMARTVETRMSEYHLAQKKHAERLLYTKKLMSSQFGKEEIVVLLAFFNHYQSATAVLQFMLLVSFVSWSRLLFCALHDGALQPVWWVWYGVVALFSLLTLRLNYLLQYYTKEDLPRVKMANMVRVFKTCSLGVALPALNQLAQLKIPRSYHTPCLKERTLEVYGTIIRGIPFVVPQACVHDIVSGLRIRFLFARDYYTGELDSEFFNFCKDFLSSTRWADWISYSSADWLHHMSGRRRNTLLQEDDNAPFEMRNWIANIFVKTEAYVGKTWSNFKPRIIQCRSSSLQLFIGPFFYSAYKFISRTFSSAGGKNIYAVSLNALELGQVASSMQGDLYEADASNWDGSVTNTFLKVEKWFIRFILPYRPHWIEQLLSKWEKTVGASQGVRYSCDWGRKSGDMWTSAFNTLLNILVTNFAWGTCLIQAVFNGDDNFFCVVPGSVADKALQAYEKLGLKMVLVKRQSWQTLEFCSGLFYQTERGVKWGLKPFRQLAKFGVNFNRHSKKKFPSLLLGSALSMMPIAGHVPIFGTVLRRIIETAGKVVPILDPRQEWQITDTISDEIHPAAIEAFKERYGLTDAEYLRLDLWASQVKLSDFPMILEDELFVRCARVDLGVSCLDETTRDGKLWYQEESGIAIDERVSPFLEELLCHYLPYFWFLIGSFETVLGSFYAIPTHFMLSKVRVYFGPVAGLVAHLLFNALVGKANLLWFSQNRGSKFRDPGLLKALREWPGTEMLRVPGVFTSILDRVGTINNRLTRYAELVRKFGEIFDQVVNKFTKNRGRRGRAAPQRAVVVVAPKKRGKKRRAGRRAGAASKFALVAMNPFLTACDGVRIPDGFAYPSATVLLRGAFELGNNPVFTSGAVICFNPFIDGFALQPASITAGGTITWSAPSVYNLPQSAAMNSAFSSFRVVGGGVRITTEQSIATASGHIWVAHVPQDFDADQYGLSYFPTTEAGFAALPLSEKYPTVELATNPLIVPFRRVDGASYRYRDCQWPQNASPYAETNSGWTSIAIYASGQSGGGLANILNIEFILHVEALHRGSSGTLIVPDMQVAPMNEMELQHVANLTANMPIAHIESKAEADEPGAWFDKMDRVLTKAARFSNSLVNFGTSAYSTYQRITGAGANGRKTNYIGYL